MINYRRFCSSFLLITATVIAASPVMADEAGCLRFQLPPADRLPTASRPLSEEWSLPLAERLSAGADLEISVADAIGKKPARRLDASINLADDQDCVANRVDQLLDAALERDERSAVLNKAVAHYRTRTQRIIAESKDTLDYVVPYRGFGLSSEAGDVILDDNVKLKSRAAAEYARQRHVDELHGKVVSNMMQIAMGIGMGDNGVTVANKGVADLAGLVGESEAAQTYDLLNTWMREIEVPEAVYEQGAWDVSTRREKFKLVLQAALEEDPVLHQITKRLHKYSKRSKVSKVSAQVVQTVLGTASLTPTLIGPAAKTALVAFIMATGGPEQCKLLKELYLDKRLESRWKALNETTQLAMENYHVGILTRNPALISCAESLIDSMSAPGTVEKVFGTRLAPARSVASTPKAADL